MTARLLGLALLALVAATQSGGERDGSNISAGSAAQIRNDVSRVRVDGVDRSEIPRQGLRAGPHVLRVHGLARDGIATPEPAATQEPTATGLPPGLLTATAPPTQDAPVYGGFPGEITHYGEAFNGQTMACGGTYWSSDTSIAAVPYPSRNREWPCGTRFVVSGPAGTIEVERTDSCPGCHSHQLDLSESGMLAVCGYLGRCPVRIEVR